MSSSDLVNFERTHKVFLGTTPNESCAATFQLISSEDNTYNTIRMEITRKKVGGRWCSQDWSDKRVVNISKAELPSVCCFMLGFRESFEGKYHGTSRNNSFSLNREKGIINLIVSNAGKWERISIKNSDIYYLTQMCLEQMIKNDPFTTKTDIINLMRCLKP